MVSADIVNQIKKKLKNSSMPSNHNKPDAQTKSEIVNKKLKKLIFMDLCFVGFFGYITGIQ